MRIEALQREQVGQLVMRTAHADLARGQVDGPRVDGVLDGINNVIAVEQSGLVQSLEIVLGKIAVIADVTVNVMDEITKVSRHSFLCEVCLPMLIWMRKGAPVR